ANGNRNWLFVLVASGQSVSGAEFLDREKDASISGLIHFDKDGNAAVNGSDSTLDGGTITLYSDTNGNGMFNGTAIDLPVSTTDAPLVVNPAGPTTASGAWSFSNLYAGTYFAVQTGYKTSDYVSTNAIPGGAAGTKLASNVLKFVIAADAASTG